jgi:hypothetical protein
MANTTTADGTCTSGAIQIAADYANNGKIDWHLPSKDELNQMCKWQRGQAWVSDATICDATGILNSGTGASGFAAAIYWSSSEQNTTNAWFQGFGGGGQFEGGKVGTSRVRSVRAFGGTLACADGGVCIVGDTGPGGGKVFYVHASGTFACGATLASTCKYLEAAPTTGTAAWTDALYIWSGNTSDAIGVTAQGIGTGYKNTQAMVTQSSTAGMAGTITRAYRGPNSLTDWHLPSKDELAQLYAQKTTVGGFSSDYYWSSSEPVASSAWAQGFNSGTQNYFTKGATRYVRPVRAFG